MDEILTNDIPSKDTKTRTFIIGSYGRGNIGDDVFLKCAINLVRDTKLYINAHENNLLPNEVTQFTSTVSTNSLRDITRKLRAFHEIKSIVYWGGDVWVNLYGNRFPRSSLYKMVLLNVVARLSGKKIYYVGTGVGKLSGYSLWLAKLSGRLANHIIMRESRSATILNLPNVSQLPDIAVNLNSFEPHLHKPPSSKDKFIIGISMLYYLPKPASTFPKVTKQLTDFIASLPEDKFKIILMPMLVTSKDKKNDIWALEQLRMKLPNHEIEMFKARNVDDFVKKTKELHLIIGARLHANILATFNGTPCIGISYRPKVKSFFADNSLSSYCLEVNEVEKLKEKFWDLYNNYDYTAKLFLDVSNANLSKRKLYQQFADTYL